MYMYSGVVLNGRVLNMSRWYIGSGGVGVAKFRFIDDFCSNAQNTMYCAEGLSCNYLDGKEHYNCAFAKKLNNWVQSRII